MANNRYHRELDDLDTGVIVSSSLYYERTDIEQLLSIFSNLEIVDFRMKEYVSILEDLLHSGNLDHLPKDPEQRKNKLTYLINDRISIIPDSKTRDKVSDWFINASEKDFDIELAEELLYRYCWAEFVDRITKENSKPTDFKDKLAIRPVVPDIASKAFQSLSDIEIPEENEEDTFVFKTGVASLDKMVKMRRTNFVVIAARTTVGKSLFMINQAICNAASGIPILYVSLEESPIELKKRVLNHVSGKSKDYVNSVLKNFIIYSPGTSNPTSILDEVARYAKENRIDVVFIDYIQLMKYPGMDDFNSLRVLTREFKLFAVKNDILLVTASQIKREAEYTGTDLTSLYGSSTLEADANIIIILENARKQAVRVNNQSSVNISVAKNRSGAQGRLDNIMIDYSCGHIVEN